jgi:serine protease Do
MSKLNQRVLGLFALPLVFAEGLSLAAPLPVTNLPDLVEKVLPGVVNISSTTIVNQQIYGMDDFLRFWGIPQERTQTTLGSGFIIDNEGYIITNNHVVEHADEVLVTLMDKRQYRARIIGKDQKMDVALILIRDKNRQVPPNITPVPMGDSETVRIAESVFAVGNPFALQHTVTMGIISAKNRTIGLGPLDNFLQTDASINPGNSGGPLFNIRGEVIGINTVIYTRTGQSGGLGFAIPINEAKQVLVDLKKYGRVPRPWLGILGERITPVLEQHYQLPVPKGIVVYNLVEKGPADRAGIRQGDIIVSVDGNLTEESYELERYLYKHRPKDTAKLQIRRGRKTLDLQVKLEELPRLENLPRGIM